MKKTSDIFCFKTIKTVSCFILVTAMLALSVSAWFVYNTEVFIETPDSSPIYAVNEGYSGDLLDKIDPKKIYPSDDHIAQAVMIPGDLVYYSCVFQIPLDNLTGTSAKYSVSLNMAPSVQSGATVGSNGNYLAFLHDCTIEENACFLSVLERNDPEEGMTTYSYTPISYAIEDGAYKRVSSGGTALLEYKSGVFESTEVASFAPDSTIASVGARFDLTFPIFDISQYPTAVDNITEKECVFFLLYVPIWYRDTRINQNEQMYSQLVINGCTLLPASVNSSGE